jgi:hypothetical protein
MKCQWPGGCGEEAARGRLHYCIKHRDENYQLKVVEANNRGTEKKRAWRADNPVLCREPGCNNPASTPKSHRCQACKDRIRAQRYTIYPKLELVEDAGGLGPKHPPKPKLRKVVAPIMTAEEQDRIDIEQRQFEERQYAARMANFGLIAAKGKPVASEVRSLSVKEIQALQSKYRPPQKVLRYVTNHACTWD